LNTTTFGLFYGIFFCAFSNLFKMETSCATKAVIGLTSGPIKVEPSAASLHWDYSPKSMDADGPNGSTGSSGVNGSGSDGSVIGDLNGDCVGADELAQTAIIKQVYANTFSCDISHGRALAK
jgi:hypothetical protein